MVGLGSSSEINAPEGGLRDPYHTVNKFYQMNVLTFSIARALYWHSPKSYWGKPVQLILKVNRAIKQDQKGNEQKIEHNEHKSKAANMKHFNYNINT